jgi:GH18 family chitinase
MGLDQVIVLIHCHQSVPSCDSTTNATTFERRIAYYELFGLSRPCDLMEPEAIAAGALTHINLAFVLFGENFNIIDLQGDIVARVSKLKLTYPGLRVNIAIGGWSFNDPPTQQYFSNMASTEENRQTFINSVMSYLQKYGLDGIDIGVYMFS